MGDTGTTGNNATGAQGTGTAGTPPPNAEAGGGTKAAAATTAAPGTDTKTVEGTTKPAGGDAGAEGGKQDAKATETESTGKSGEAKAQESTATDFEVKLPAGVEADPEMMGAFKAMAKETGLSAEHAQKIVDIYANAHQVAQRKAQDAWVAEQAAWVKAIQTDKELGGTNLKATQATTQRVMAKYARPEFNKFLEESGVGNHPEMVRFIAEVGRDLKEDAIAGTSAQEAGGGKLTETEKALQRYPSMRGS